MFSLAATIAAILAAACETPAPKQIVQARGGYDPDAECVDHDNFSFNGTTYDTLSVSKYFTKIPEFHDCQRLIDSTGLAYGPLVGVFVSYQIESLQVPHILPAVPPGVVGPYGVLTPISPVPVTTTVPAAPLTKVFASAELLSFDGDYEALGIKKGFNCLYLIEDITVPSRISARMVPVGDVETNCGRQYDPSFGGTVLATQAEYQLFKPTDYPPVARWEWDPDHNLQIIGIRCFPTWCHVGPLSASPSLGMDVNSTQVPDPKELRTFLVRGWHDEQRLALSNASSGLDPGYPVATVVPDKDLDKWNDVSDFKNWKQVARIFFSPNSPQYQTDKKYNFAGATGGKPPTEMTKVYMCGGTHCFSTGETAPTCPASPDGLTWYARVDPIGKGKGRPRCVYRQVITINGTVYDPPATARWRWQKTDETLWARCAKGCCQVN